MQKFLLLSPSSIFMTGGEKVFLQLVDNVSKLQVHEILIVAPKFIKHKLENQGNFSNKNIRFKSIDLINNTDFIEKNVFLLYFLRSIKLFLLLIQKRPHIILNNDDNVLFILVITFYIKVFKPKTRYFQNFFHMSKSCERRKGFHSRIYLVSQKIVLQLIMKSTTIIVINQTVERFFRQNFKNKLIRLKLGLSIGDIDILKKTNNQIIENEYDIAWVGRLTSSKGIMDLIEILKLTAERGAIMSLILIGRVSKNISNLIDENLGPYTENGKLRLKFLEYQVNMQEVFENLKKANTLVLTSREEGFSFVILEALNLKLNVVCWDLTTLREIYGENLTYIKKFSYNNFSSAIIEAQNIGSQISEIELNRLNRIDFSLLNSELSSNR